MSYSKHVPVTKDNTTIHYCIEIIEDAATITCLKNGNLIYCNMVPTELLRGLPSENTFCKKAILDVWNSFLTKWNPRRNEDYRVYKFLGEFEAFLTDTEFKDDED